jgi:hypothetical protein
LSTPFNDEKFVFGVMAGGEDGDTLSIPFFVLA